MIRFTIHKGATSIKKTPFFTTICYFYSGIAPIPPFLGGWAETSLFHQFNNNLLFFNT